MPNPSTASTAMTTTAIRRKLLVWKRTIQQALSSSISFFQQNHRVPVNRDVVQYSAVFFVAMIGHELALEAAVTNSRTKSSNNSSSSQNGGDGLSSAVTLFQFGFCLLLPLIVTKGKALSKFPRTIRELGPYLLLSIVVAGATAVATEAVRYVSYPTKVVFKSAKLIPTMIVATILHRKTYHLREYIAATLLCIGAAGYAYNNNGSSLSSPNSNSLKGILMLVVSIVCDAIVPNLQKLLMSPPSSPRQRQQQPSAETVALLPTDKSKNNTITTNDEWKSHSPHDEDISDGEKTHHQQQPQRQQVTASELMMNVNAIGFIGVLFYMMIRGELSSTTTTAISTTQPQLLMYLVLVGIGLSTAVYNYTSLIQSSGSVVAVSVATLRKVVTVILSYVVFPKPLSFHHIISGIFVLAGILLSSVQSNNNNSKNLKDIMSQQSTASFPKFKKIEETVELSSIASLNGNKHTSSDEAVCRLAGHTICNSTER